MGDDKRDGFLSVEQRRQLDEAKRAFDAAHEGVSIPELPNCKDPPGSPVVTDETEQRIDDAFRNFQQNRDVIVLIAAIIKEHGGSMEVSAGALLHIHPRVEVVVRKASELDTDTVVLEVLEPEPSDV